VIAWSRWPCSLHGRVANALATLDQQAVLKAARTAADRQVADPQARLPDKEFKA
jgi:hypothetical protein